MKVALLAHTTIDPWAMSRIGYTVHVDGSEPTDADELAEFAGRNCYRSFDRPNPKTAANDDYIANIIRQDHESVFEHASATFYIEASRSVLAELTRHRFLSFSVVSQRYVSPEKMGKPHRPPLVSQLPHREFVKVDNVLLNAWSDALRAYDQIFESLRDQGVPLKQAREAARAVLPNMTNSPMVVSGNHRAWKDSLRKRWHMGADAEIRALAGMLLAELRKIAPHTYQDIPTEPYE